MWTKKILYIFGLSVFASLLSLCSGAFSSSASATSQSFTYTANDVTFSTNAGIDIDSLVSNLGFTPDYITISIDQSSYIQQCMPGPSVCKIYLSPIQNNNNDNYQYVPLSFYQATDTSTYNNLPLSITTAYRSGLTLYSYIYSRQSVFAYFGSISITFSDNQCPACPTCPEIPANPYDDKLDNIYHAILLVGASFVVIMFLYQILRIYVRSWS